jgi:hypothetical protein
MRGILALFMPAVVMAIMPDNLHNPHVSHYRSAVVQVQVNAGCEKCFVLHESNLAGERSGDI